MPNDKKYPGLTKHQAETLLKKFGPNEIKDVGKTSAWRILLRQVRNNLIVYLLFFAMVISFFVGKDITGYTILVVILLVVFVGFLQEYKAEKAIEYLKKMVMPVSVVRRDGEDKELPSAEIVPDDILVLRTGEKVPADCLILEEKELLVNEAVLTGEAREVAKTAAGAKSENEDSGMVFAGSFIVNGKCLAQVVHTGMNTRFGKIAGMISASEKSLPLQDKINRITKYMAFIGLAIAFTTGSGILLSSEITNERIIEVLILTIAISVASFPEGFPVVLITALSLGAHRMAKKNATVNRMSIIETLGETTVICSDKTGTITKGEMTVKKIYCGGRTYDLSGVGYGTEGGFQANGKNIDPDKENVLKLFLKTAVLCNDAKIKHSGGEKSYRVSGLPTEASLLVMAAKAGIFKEDLFSERFEELTFSSERKMMSVLIKDEKGSIVYSKGALDILLKKCTHIQKISGIVKMSAKEKDKINDEFAKMADASYRTIALAWKKTDHNDKDSLEKDLVFLGLAGIEDPPRDEVKEAIRVCRRAGIAVKMITGDHQATALSVARQIGLDSGRVVNGDELDQLTDDELTKVVNEITVFSRVRPEHKLRIVHALKKNDEIVTMTGDGVNDSPALKEAHIGVAMGIAGTDVSRSVADLTLKDDNFATIVDAIKEGRTIFHNIRKFATYQISCNYAAISVLLAGVLLAPFLGWPVPILLALHILFMNLVTDNLPAITLGFNQSSADIMEDPPRKKADIFTRDLLILLVISGMFMAVFTIGAFYFTYNILGQSIEDARTTTLLVLIIAQLAGAFNFRSFRKSVFGRSLFVNKYLVFASLASILATVAIIYTPLSRSFETVPIGWTDWAVALIIALLMVTIFDALKYINNRKKYLILD